MASNSAANNNPPVSTASSESNAGEANSTQDDLPRLAPSSPSNLNTSTPSGTPQSGTPVADTATAGSTTPKSLQTATAPSPNGHPPQTFAPTETLLEQGTTNPTSNPSPNPAPTPAPTPTKPKPKLPLASTPSPPQNPNPAPTHIPNPTFLPTPPPTQVSNPNPSYLSTPPSTQSQPEAPNSTTTTTIPSSTIDDSGSNFQELDSVLDDFDVPATNTNTTTTTTTIRPASATFRQTIDGLVEKYPFNRNLDSGDDDEKKGDGL